MDILGLRSITNKQQPQVIILRCACQKSFRKEIHTINWVPAAVAQDDKFIMILDIDKVFSTDEVIDFKDQLSKVADGIDQIQ